MIANKNYIISSDHNLDSVFADLNKKNTQLNSLKITDSDLWETILFKLKVDWTYHSNSIEGSTFTRGDTIFFLKEGLTVKGKPLKDHLDTQNHADAIDCLFDVVANKRGISESLIKEINALLLHGVNTTGAITSAGIVTKKKATPGQYKVHANYVLQQNGNIHKYGDPLQVASEMATLCHWIRDHINTDHPCYVAAVAHYNLVRIHPFDDGNGRVARILMNLILLKSGYFPAIIRVDNRQDYIMALETADAGNLVPFVEFVAKELSHTLETAIQNISQHSDI